MQPYGPLELVRVAPEEKCHGQSHQGSIKYIHTPFDTQQVAITAHGILDDTEDVPNHDEGRRGVEHDEVLLPRHINSAVSIVTITAEAPVEDHGSDDEDGEDGDLEDQAPDNNIGAQIGIDVRVPRACLYAKSGATGLNNEAEDVARDEYGCEPSGPDGCMFLAVNGDDDATERHIERGSQENRPEEEQGRLDNVGHQLAGAIMGQGSTDISHNLD